MAIKTDDTFNLKVEGSSINVLQFLVMQGDGLKFMQLLKTLGHC